MDALLQCHGKAVLHALQLLAKNFAAMQRLGDPVLKPFLQVSGLPEVLI